MMSNKGDDLEDILVEAVERVVVRMNIKSVDGQVVGTHVETETLRARWDTDQPTFEILASA
jgi:hypothetical protein